WKPEPREQALPGPGIRGPASAEVRGNGVGQRRPERDRSTEPAYEQENVRQLKFPGRHRSSEGRSVQRMVYVITVRRQSPPGHPARVLVPPDFPEQASRYR